jgi:hypothetical protein
MSEIKKYQVDLPVTAVVNAKTPERAENKVLEVINKANAFLGDNEAIDLSMNAKPKVKIL